MKSKASKKITALFVTLCMVLSLIPAAIAAPDGDEPDGEAAGEGIASVTYNAANEITEDFTVTINDAAISNGVLTSADVTVTGEGGATLFAAVYENGLLVSVDSAAVTETGTAEFDGEMSFDAAAQTLRIYAWDGMTPVGDVFIKTDIPTTSPTEVPELVPYTATFAADDGVSSIDIYYTQDYTNADETDVETAYARDGSTGEISTDGGQINFVVNLADGFRIASVTASGNYKNIKGPADTALANGYRITKITGDLTITVITETIAEETGDNVIHLSDNNITAISSSGSAIANVTVDNTKNTVTITPASSGESYTIDGSLTDGQIIVAAGGKKYQTTLTLNSVSVSCSTGSPLYVTEGKTIINTNNTDSVFLCTAEEYAQDGATEQETAAINTKRDTTIQGGGSVTATSANGNAIHCKKDLTIGDTDITANGGNNGIKGKQSVTIAENAGKITVTSVKDGITSDYAPEIDAADNTVAASIADMGTDAGGAVTINGGTINITTTGTTKTGDGIQADSLLTVNGGTITVNATGEAIKANCSHLDYAGADDYDEYKSALEAYDGSIVITGGTINASAGEDGIKAVKGITVSGGDTTVVSAGDEGIQVSEIAYGNTNETAVSDFIAGSINITDGKVTVTKSTGDALQCGTGDVNISGGTVTVNAAGDEGIQAGKVEVCTDSQTPVFYDLTGDVNISGGTINITSDSDGITAAGTYKQTGSPVVTIVAGSKSSAASCDGIQAGKAYTAYDIGTGTDDSAVLHETIGVADIEGGTLTITACGGAYDTIKSSGDSNGTKKDFSCKGIKARSLVDISGGTVNVNAYDDAIHSNHTVNISGGKTTAQSCDDGIHAEYFLNITDGEINITKGYEGLEAAEFSIDGGTADIYVYDDGVNASGVKSEISGKTAYTLSNVYSGSASLNEADVQLMAGRGGFGGNPGGPGDGGGGWGGGGDPAGSSSDYGKLYIKGGTIHIITEYGDGIDSNGDLAVSGGVTVVDASTLGGSDSDGLDAESITITDGYVITMSMGGMESAGTFSQKSVIYGSWSSGGGFGGMGGSSSGISAGNYVITDSDGNILCAFKRTSGRIARVLFSSPKLSSGTYYLKSMSGSAALINGLYGTVNSSYAFAAASGVSAGSTSYTMTTK